MPGGCPLTPKSAIESHLGFAESSRVHEPISTSQFAAVAALPPRTNSLRYTDGVPGPILPLPPEQLLGAGSAQERDDLAEAVARHYANEPQPTWKYVVTKPQPAWVFVGFRYARVWEGGQHPAECDFPPELLRRLKDLKPRVRPVSDAEWGRYDPSRGVVDSDSRLVNGNRFQYLAKPG
jgi:hypothetical protein